LKFVSRTIPHSGGYNTPQLAAELGSRACPGFHTRDFRCTEQNLILGVKTVANFLKGCFSNSAYLCNISNSNDYFKIIDIKTLFPYAQFKRKKVLLGNDGELLYKNIM